MADLVTKLRLDNSEFNSNIDSAKQKTAEFQRTADGTKKTLNELGDKGSKSARELLNEMNNLNNSGRGATNYRRQLKEIQNTLNDLTISYRQMSDEMKASPIGQEVAGKIQELTAQAAQYKDAIQDVQQEIQRMSSDTAVWDGMKEGIQTVSGAMQAFVASGVLGEKQTEKLVAVLAKLKAIEAATNAVIRVGNALQRNSSLMAAVSTIRHKALAAAKEREALATTHATAAQTEFNIAAYANPYVLLAAAIVAVCAALAIFVIRTNEANDAQAKANKSFEEFQNKLKDSREETGKTIAKFKVLEGQYKSLKTEAEKNKWITDNKDKFHDLGLELNNINDADDVFIKNADKVIQAMRLRSEAAAMMTAYEEEYAKAYKETLDLMDERQKSFQTQERFLKVWKDAGLDRGTDVKQTKTTNQMGITDAFTLTDSGKAKLKEYYKNLGDARMKAFEDKYLPVFDDINKKLAEASVIESEVGHQYSGDTKGNKKEKEEEIFDTSSLKAANDQVSALKKQLDSMKPNDEGYESVLIQLRSWESIQKNLTELTKETADETESVLDKWKKISNEAEEINTKLSIGAIDASEAQKLVDNLNAALEAEGLTARFEVDLDENSVKRVKKEVEEELSVLDKWRKISSSANEINTKLNIGAIDTNEAQKQVDALNAALEAEGLTARFKVDLDENSVKRVKEEVEEIGISLNEAAGGMVGSTGRIVGSFNSVYESVKGLDDKLDEAKNGWEAFFAVFETGMTILEAITNIIQAITTMSQLLTTITEANTAAKTKNIAATTSEAAAASADATAQASDSGATMTNAAAHGAAAAAKSGESAASIPVVGWVVAPLAIAAVLAAVIAAIGALSAFADGGVVGGHSYYGDKVLARVNSGELILSQKQQQKLWGMMSSPGGSSVSGNVEFKIKGSDLYGALSNYTKKMDKV